MNDLFLEKSKWPQDTIAIIPQILTLFHSFKNKFNLFSFILNSLFAFFNLKTICYLLKEGNQAKQSYKVLASQLRYFHKSCLARKNERTF